MTESQLVLFSVDDHLMERGDAYVDHVPKSLAERAPRLVEGPDEDYWVIDGERIPMYGSGMESAAGRDPRAWRFDPMFRRDEMRAGCYDPKARLADMDVDGVAAQVLFPSAMSRFVGDRFLHLQDKELAAAFLRAYNDYVLEEWRGADPDRLIPVVLLPLWDPQASAAEVYRTVEMGAKTVAGAMQLHNLGYPISYDEHWDPLWGAISETGVPVSCHSHTTAVSMPEMTEGRRLTFGASPALLGLGAMTGTAEMLLTQPQLFTRFPDLQFVVTEGGIGWVPYILERCEWAYEKHRYWAHLPDDVPSPKEVFQEHFTVCFVDDPAGIELRDRIGVERICWESDYPHTDSVWPHSRKMVGEQLAGCSPEEVALITHQNAERVYRHEIPDHVKRHLEAAH